MSTTCSLPSCKVQPAVASLTLRAAQLRGGVQLKQEMESPVKKQRAAELVEPLNFVSIESVVTEILHDVPLTSANGKGVGGLRMRVCA